MIGLLDFLEEHRDAVAYDLMSMGYRLRDFPSPALTYGDLLVVVRQCPAGSAVARSVDPEQSAWGISEHLLATAADSLAWLVWAKSEDASKRRNKPRPIPRPGVVDPDRETQVIGSAPVPLDELDDFLEWGREIAGVIPPADEPDN